MPKGSSDDELALFLGIADRMGLDPFAQQIRAIRRKEYNADTQRYEDRISIEPGIDGFRLVARRTRELEGRLGPFWCGDDGKWVEMWLSEEPPAAARVGVLRKGDREPWWAVAHWREYRQTKRDGGVTKMWSDRPAGQLAKCAEALALRAAFPHELGGVYTTEEMAQADRDDTAATISRFAVVEGGVPSEDTIRGLESAEAAKELVTRELVSDHFRQAVKVAQVEIFGEVWDDFWRHANLASWVNVLLEACRAVQPQAIEAPDPVTPAAPHRPAGSGLTSEAGERGNVPDGDVGADQRNDPASDLNASVTAPGDTDASAGQEPRNTEAPTPERSRTSPRGRSGSKSRSEVPAGASGGDQLGEAPPAGPTDEQAEQAEFDQQLVDADRDAGRWTR